VEAGDPTKKIRDSVWPNPRGAVSIMKSRMSEKKKLPVKVGQNGERTRKKDRDEMEMKKQVGGAVGRKAEKMG